MSSRGANLAENWCDLYSFSRGIRIWHSRGPVRNKNDKKQQNFSKKTYFLCGRGHGHGGRGHGGRGRGRGRGRE